MDHGQESLTAYEFRCPFGLVFDQDRLVCEWSWLVPKCVGGSHIGAETSGISQPSGGVDGDLNLSGGDNFLLENYNGLGVLEEIKLGGITGYLEHPSYEIYATNDDVGNYYQTDNTQNVLIREVDGNHLQKSITADSAFGGDVNGVVSSNLLLNGRRIVYGDGNSENIGYDSIATDDGDSVQTLVHASDGLSFANFGHGTNMDKSENSYSIDQQNNRRVATNAENRILFKNDNLRINLNGNFGNNEQNVALTNSESTANLFDNENVDGSFIQSGSVDTTYSLIDKGNVGYSNLRKQDEGRQVLLTAPSNLLKTGQRGSIRYNNALKEQASAFAVQVNDVISHSGPISTYHGSDGNNKLVLNNHEAVRGEFGNFGSAHSPVQSRIRNPELKQTVEGEIIDASGGYNEASNSKSTILHGEQENVVQLLTEIQAEDQIHGNVNSGIGISDLGYADYVSRIQHSESDTSNNNFLKNTHGAISEVEIPNLDKNVILSGTQRSNHRNEVQHYGNIVSTSGLNAFENENLEKSKSNENQQNIIYNGFNTDSDSSSIRLGTSLHEFSQSDSGVLPGSTIIENYRRSDTNQHGVADAFSSKISTTANAGASIANTVPAFIHIEYSKGNAYNNANLVNVGTYNNFSDHLNQEITGVTGSEARQDGSAISTNSQSGSTQYFGNFETLREHTDSASGISGNVNIISGGFSAVGATNDARSGVKLIQNGVSVDNVEDVTSISIPVTPVAVTTSNIPVVTSVPVPSIKSTNEFEVLNGGVVANVPQLQYKVGSQASSVNNIFRTSFKNEHNSFSHGSSGYVNKNANTFDHVTSSVPDLSISNGYIYPKPDITFLEEPKVVQHVNPVTISSYIKENPLISSSKHEIKTDRGNFYSGSSVVQSNERHALPIIERQFAPVQSTPVSILSTYDTPRNTGSAAEPAIQHKLVPVQPTPRTILNSFEESIVAAKVTNPTVPAIAVSQSIYPVKSTSTVHDYYRQDNKYVESSKHAGEYQGTYNKPVVISSFTISQPTVQQYFVPSQQPVATINREEENVQNLHQQNNSYVGTSRSYVSHNNDTGALENVLQVNSPFIAVEPFSFVHQPSVDEDISRYQQYIQQHRLDAVHHPHAISNYQHQKLSNAEIGYQYPKPSAYFSEELPTTNYDNIVTVKEEPFVARKAYVTGSRNVVYNKPDVQLVYQPIVESSVPTSIETYSKARPELNSEYLVPSMQGSNVQLSTSAPLNTVSDETHLHSAVPSGQKYHVSLTSKSPIPLSPILTANVKPKPQNSFSFYSHESEEVLVPVYSTTTAPLISEVVTQSAPISRFSFGSLNENHSNSINKINFVSSTPQSINYGNAHVTTPIGIVTSTESSLIQPKLIDQSAPVKNFSLVNSFSPPIVHFTSSTQDGTSFNPVTQSSPIIRYSFGSLYQNYGPNSVSHTEDIPDTVLRTSQIYLPSTSEAPLLRQRLVTQSKPISRYSFSSLDAKYNQNTKLSSSNLFGEQELVQEIIGTPETYFESSVIPQRSFEANENINQNLGYFPSYNKISFEDAAKPYLFLTTAIPDVRAKTIVRKRPTSRNSFKSVDQSNDQETALFSRNDFADTYVSNDVSTSKIHLLPTVYNYNNIEVTPRTVPFEIKQENTESKPVSRYSFPVLERHNKNAVPLESSGVLLDGDHIDEKINTQEFNPTTEKYESLKVITPFVTSTISPITSKIIQSRPISRYTDVTDENVKTLEFTPITQQYEFLKVNTPLVTSTIAPITRPISRYTFSSLDNAYSHDSTGAFLVDVSNTTPNILYSTITSPTEVKSRPVVDETIIEDYKSNLGIKTRKPTKIIKVVKPKTKTIIKVNDFHPLLSAKLGAQCTCISNDVVLRKYPIQVHDEVDDENVEFVSQEGDVNDDVSIVFNGESDTYESSRKVTPTPETFLNISSVSTSELPQFVRKRVKIRPLSSTTAYDALVTKATDTFVKGISTIKPLTVEILKSEEEGPNEEDVKKVVTKGLSLVKSVVKQGVKEILNERNVPGAKSHGEMDCQRVGLFRHPTQCNKFYSCSWDCYKNKFTLHVFNCPVHLTFDSNSGACNWPSQGPACLGNTLLPSV